MTEDDADANAPEEAAAEQRLEALRQLAQAQQQAGEDALASASATLPTSARLASRRSAARTQGRRSKWRMAVAVVAACAAGLSVLGFYATQRGAPRQPPAKPLEIALERDGVACPTAVAWSPDGSRLAVVGYQHDCPSDEPTSYTYQPGVVALYEATTGTLLGMLAPDRALAQRTSLPTPSAVTPAAPQANTSSPVINYTQITWSPDGQRLALTFTLAARLTVCHGQDFTLTLGQPTLHGALVLSLDGAPLFAVTEPMPVGTPYAGEWDLRQGSALPRQAGDPGGTALAGTASLPPALRYHWGENGQLVPEILLNSVTAPAAAPVGPIGNLAGGASFSIWQPGRAAYTIQVFRDCRPAIEQVGAYTFEDAFLAWSPDGRYLAESAGFQGRVQPAGQPTPSAETLHNLALEGTPLLPVRDAALQRVLAAVPRGGARFESVAAAVAWRPDGQALATQVTGGDITIVTLYACATGNQLMTITAPTRLPSGGDTALRWSPNGSRLLLLNGSYARRAIVTIWELAPMPT
jgi:WD40-like Beta Propeller Repeat